MLSGRISKVNFNYQRVWSSTGAAITKNYINGKAVESKTKELIDLYNPATNEIFQFYTETKTITAQWSATDASGKGDDVISMPTLR